MVFDGFSFYKFSSAKANQTWYCSQRKPKKCRASVKLFMDGSHKILIRQHTHTPIKLNAPVYQTPDSKELYFDELDTSFIIR